VLFSAYFQPVGVSTVELASPSDTNKVYREVLRGTKLDILMLNDGVGARGLAALVGPLQGEYFEAFRDACGSENVEFWANLECYQKGGALVAPAPIARLKQQFQAVNGIPREFVTWDFFHFMNPNVYLDPIGNEIIDMCKGGAAAGRGVLYRDYRRDFTP
jgi:hypothetical protein